MDFEHLRQDNNLIGARILYNSNLQNMQTSL